MKTVSCSGLNLQMHFWREWAAKVAINDTGTLPSLECQFLLARRGKIKKTAPRFGPMQLESRLPVQKTDCVKPFIRDKPGCTPLASSSSRAKPSSSCLHIWLITYREMTANVIKWYCHNIVMEYRVLRVKSLGWKFSHLKPVYDITGLAVRPSLGDSLRPDRQDWLWLTVADSTLQMLS